MVNNTDQHQTVLAYTVVGRGAITQEQEDLAETLSTSSGYMELDQGEGETFLIPPPQG